MNRTIALFLIIVATLSLLSCDSVPQMSDQYEVPPGPDDLLPDSTVLIAETFNEETGELVRAAAVLNERELGMTPLKRLFESRNAAKAITFRKSEYHPTVVTFPLDVDTAKYQVPMAPIMEPPDSISLDVTVVDALNGEALSANVELGVDRNLGVSPIDTSLAYEKAQYQLTASMDGYHTQSVAINLATSLEGMTVFLVPKTEDRPQLQMFRNGIDLYGDKYITAEKNVVSLDDNVRILRHQVNGSLTLEVAGRFSNGSSGQSEEEFTPGIVVGQDTLFADVSEDENNMTGWKRLSFTFSPDQVDQLEANRGYEVVAVHRSYFESIGVDGPHSVHFSDLGESAADGGLWWQYLYTPQ